VVFLHVAGTAEHFKICDIAVPAILILVMNDDVVLGTASLA
jgi:hypothetical protein